MIYSQTFSNTLISRLGAIGLISRIIMKITRRFHLLKFFLLFCPGPHESTIEAYKKAHVKGFRVLLCAARLTKDVQFVCSHDDDISNIVYCKDLSGKKKISLTDLAELEHARFFTNSLKRGKGLLSLDAFLDFCDKNKLMAEIEIKDFLTHDLITKLQDIVKKHHMESRVILHRNQGEPEMMKELGFAFPNALLSRTANNLTAMEEMMHLQVPCQKMVTITNYNGRLPETLKKSNLEKLNAAKIGVIFSEVKNRQDKKQVSIIQPYLSFIATRFIKIGE